ncbi:FAD/NAD(P)-binding domain-containing protein [Phialemonium atrogriseum]|uniref:FAD/NAD(P)-binding domain-containing protein n=1 Tax=Phialemonium atrogriseum TaxID=1093897 RepID=A0AAJ0BZ84_9PEZI|nr:FAD/NAD(P)-binding domain-containing protein [Phialemonium atrogriseum]KAK1765844.1 FAD/NAD(P)-binding domain-containing protein [Phialemonium atrogriseum]
MPLSHILILGAGPAGLSAALAISQLPPPPSPAAAPRLRVTVLELRPRGAGTTLGGAVNLTPLALRYLDRLGGAGALLRPRGCAVGAGIDMVALRTGSRRGTLWRGVDMLRVRRHDLAESLRGAVEEGDAQAADGRGGGVELRYGVSVVGIREEGEAGGEGAVVLELEGGEEIRGDVLLGCDGLHSVARTRYVEPEREKVYSGRVNAYGYAKVEEPGKAGITRSDGQPCVVDSTLISGRYGSLLATFFEPERKGLFVAAVMGMKDVGEDEDARDGWKAMGDDKAKVREDIARRFRDGKISGVTELVESVEEWNLFPVYQLPPQGRWSRGRVILLGDAAHAMPPQGESTGVAIEDGVLIARILQRHTERSIPQLFDDYEKLRRAPIDKLYKESVWRWDNAAKDDSGWLHAVFNDWMITAVLAFMDFNQSDYFANDVENLQLPP